MASRNGKNGNGKTAKVTGGTPELRKAATEQSKKATTADLAENVTVVKEEHTRLAEPGEGPETRTGEFETKVRLGADKETHTRLATPADPEAQEIHRETQRVNKETGRAPVEKVQNAKDLPNEGDSPREKRAKQQAIFDKADEAGQAEIIETNRRTNAALGGGF
jgi:hypothetical protein